MPEPYEQLMSLCSHYHESPAEVLSRSLDMLYRQTIADSPYSHHMAVVVMGGYGPGKVDQLMRDFLDVRVFYTELLAAAFLQKFPGIEPDECEIVTEWGTGNVTITVRKKT